MKTSINIMYAGNTLLTISYEDKEKAMRHYAVLKEAGKLKESVSLTDPFMTINMAGYLWMLVVDG